MIDVRNMDCMDLFKELNDESIDLIVTDPPYLIQQHSSSGLHGIFETKKGDKKDLNCKLFKENAIPLEVYAKELFRVLKNGSHCYIMVNDYNLPNFLNTLQDVGFHYSKLLTWDKQNKIACPYYMNQCEYIIFLSKGNARKINDCGTSNLISINNMANKNNGHPTEKPVELMEIFIKNSSNVGDLILDPFVGVGATPIACKNLGRNFIGCELDKKYYDKTMERLNTSIEEFFV